MRTRCWTSFACGRSIEKTRYRIPQDDIVWEIDEFEGDNRGLIVAEVELKDEHQSFKMPDWIGQEVTDDPRYFNANLVAKPFTRGEDQNSARQLFARAGVITLASLHLIVAATWCEAGSCDTSHRALSS